MKATTSSPPEEVTTWTTSQVVFATIFVVCVSLIFWLLYRLQTVLFLFFIAMVFGTAIRPAVEWLYRRGVSRTTGVILVYLLLGAVLTAFLALIVPLLAEQSTQFSGNLPELYDRARGWLLDSDNRVLRNIGARIPAQLSRLLSSRPSSAEVLDQVTQTILYANLVIKGLISTLAVFLLAYYWTQESNAVLRTVLRIIPLKRKKEFLEFLDHVETKLGGYVRGQGILCLSIGVAAFLAYLLIGLPYALVLGIIAGFTEMIPVFGPALGAVPAMLVASSLGVDKAIWVLAATVLIQALESVLLVPRVMNNAMGVNPIIVLLSMVAFGSVFGLVGALLALPLAAILQFIINRALTVPENSTAGDPPREVDLQPLLSESEQLSQTLAGFSANGAAELPAELRADLEELVGDLHTFLVQLRNEDEML